MALSAVTPRVRAILVCDEITASPTEYEVFNLEGVRQQLYAESFPWRVPLSVFLLLSSPRTGWQYPGRIVILNEANNRLVRYIKFVANFQEANQLFSLSMDLGDCVFPTIGRYNFEVHFSSRDGDVQKGEQRRFPSFNTRSRRWPRNPHSPSGSHLCGRVDVEIVTDPVEIARMEEIFVRTRHASFYRSEASF